MKSQNIADKLGAVYLTHEEDISCPFDGLSSQKVDCFGGAIAASTMLKESLMFRSSSINLETKAWDINHFGVYMPTDERVVHISNRFECCTLEEFSRLEEVPLGDMELALSSMSKNPEDLSFWAGFNAFAGNQHKIRRIDAQAALDAVSTIDGSKLRGLEEAISEKLSELVV